MGRKRNNILKKRIAGASISSVISISFVLMLVGLSAILALSAGSIVDYFKENIQITAFLKQGTPAVKAVELQAELEKEPFVKETHYISVEQGTQELVDMLGEDFADVFVTSPVPSSIELMVYSKYYDTDSLDVILNKLVDYPLIESASTQAAMAQSVGGAIKQIGGVLGVLVILLTFISAVLVSNTVRLIIYSSRFSIHAMQLVGASNSFIEKPFLRKFALMGFVSGLLACAVIAVGLVYTHSIFPQVFELFEPLHLAEVGVGVVLLGVLMCLLCAKVVMGKVVRLDKDELYG
ncbi:MAG TPA: hypothetical protein DHU75_00875 [Rikenellaceae bacterium]|nr:hypothetical protein [Rikenellaceae bacterium]